jgi:hypothetical protein
MQQALSLSAPRSLLVPLLAFAIGAGGATVTYAAIDGASFDISSSGDAPAVKSAPVAPHAGVGGTAVETPSPSTAHKGGGPPAEVSPAQEAAEAVRTDPHGTAALLRSAQR